MIIDFSKFTESLSAALDYAEDALIGVRSLHGIRVAVLTNRMGAYLGYDEDTLYILSLAALLHDCAVSEYLSDELRSDGKLPDEADMAAHCRVGEAMLMKLPGYERVKGAVLYHHERADGKGALGLSSEDVPLYAQLIHLADAADVTFGLDTCSSEKYVTLCDWVRANTWSAFSEECADAFLNSIDPDFLQSIAESDSRLTFRKLIPGRMIDISMPALREMSSIFADITDYKSHFTWRHSMGIAQKAETMGRFYALPVDFICPRCEQPGTIFERSNNRFKIPRQYAFMLSGI